VIKTVITGVGRCGTSLLARHCADIGYAPASRLHWHNRINAGYEDLECVALNKAIRLGGEISPDMERWPLTTTLKVVKDPWFVLAGEKILPWWIKLMPDLSFIVMYRDLHASSKSRLMATGEINPESRRSYPRSYPRSEINIRDIDQQVSRTRRAEKEFVRAGNRLGVKMHFLCFPEILERYWVVHDTLSRCGLSVDYQEGEEKWNSLADKSKVHH